MKAKKACPLAARIKKMLQADDDVGKIAQATPVMLARAMELFLQRLCEKAASVAQARNAKTITTGHLKQCVLNEETLDFLKEVVASAPDLPPEDAETKAAPKRRRHIPSAADSGAVSDPGGEVTGVKRPRPRPRKSDPPAGGVPEEHGQVWEATAQQGQQDVAMSGDGGGPDLAGTEQLAKGLRGGRAGKTSPSLLKSEQQAEQGHADAGSEGRSLLPPGHPAGQEHQADAAPFPKKTLHMQGLDAPRLPPVHQEVEHSLNHTGNGSTAGDAPKRPRARAPRSKATQGPTATAAKSEPAQKSDVCIKSEAQGPHTEQHKTPATATVTVASLASGVLSMIRNSTSRQTAVEEAPQGVVFTDDIGAHVQGGAGPLIAPVSANTAPAHLQGVTEAAPSDTTAASQHFGAHAGPALPAACLSDSSKEGRPQLQPPQIASVGLQQPASYSMGLAAVAAASVAAQTTGAVASGSNTDAHGALKRGGKAGSSLRSSHPLAFRKAKPEPKKPDATSDSLTAVAQLRSSVEGAPVPSSAWGQDLDGAVLSCRAMAAPPLQGGSGATDMIARLPVTTLQGDATPATMTQVPATQVLQPQQLQPPLMPLLPNLAHLQAVPPQDYDDDYDNL